MTAAVRANPTKYELEDDDAPYPGSYCIGAGCSVIYKSSSCSIFPLESSSWELKKDSICSAVGSAPDSYLMTWATRATWSDEIWVHPSSSVYVGCAVDFDSSYVVVVFSSTGSGSFSSLVSASGSSSIWFSVYVGVSSTTSSCSDVISFDSSGVV